MERVHDEAVGQSVAAGLDGHGTVQTPLIGGDTAHEHFFGGTGGVEAVIEGPGGAG
ncbi:MAG: hypothetical protein ACLP59_35190 [Bryobacteraceae bacterium]